MTVVPFTPREPTRDPDAGREVALVLAGGNALGAYQAGAVVRMLQAGVRPSRVAGTSIGAVQAAILAGNPPELVPERLRLFWDRISRPGSPWSRTGPWGRWTAMAEAMAARWTGRPGLFRRAGGLFGPPESIGLLDLEPLARTLDELVDFDRLNDGTTRVTVVATDLETGEPVRFDTAEGPVGPRHVLASCSFPPDFRPVEIDGRHLGDGGLVANAPVDAVLDDPPASDLLCLVVELFDRRGPAPTDIDAMLVRVQDLVFARQSRLALDLARERLKARRLRRGPEEGSLGDVTLVRLVQRQLPSDTALRLFDYGAHALAARWRIGAADMEEALDLARRTRRDPQGRLTVHEVRAAATRGTT